MGHDVAILCFYGLHGAPLQWQDITCYPGGVDGWGNDVITAYAMHHFGSRRGDGWIIALQDAWTLRTDNLREMNVAAWAPVDHYDAPPRVVKFFEHFSAVPIAMSEHGRDAYVRAGLKPLYVPHGIDTHVFKPMPEVRDEGRETLGIPKDAFVYGMVANNNGTPYPSRKSFPEVLQAFKVIHGRHPDTFLYLHTIKGQMYKGMDIGLLARELELPEDSYGFVDQFAFVLGEIAPTDMPGIYSCLDVLLNPAMGEGFGMPILEAQSCGVNVIVADNTTQTELGQHGWVIPSYKHWDALQEQWWGSVHVDELVDAMDAAYEEGQGVNEAAHKWAAANYDDAEIMQSHWKPALAELKKMMKSPKAKSLL